MTKNSKPQDPRKQNEGPEKLPPPASRLRDKIDRVKSMTKEEGRRIHREKIRSLGAALTLQFEGNVFEEPSPDQGDSH